MPLDAVTQAAAAEGATGAAPVDLAAYAGKYPDVPVGGVSWDRNAQVIAGVKAAVADPARVARVLDYSGPAMPIVLVDGKAVAANCEASDCAARNWEVFVDTATGATEVCFHDEAQTPGKSIWYMPGGRQEQRAGACIIG